MRPDRTALTLAFALLPLLAACASGPPLADNQSAVPRDVYGNPVLEGQPLARDRHGLPQEVDAAAAAPSPTPQEPDETSFVLF